MTIRIHDSTKRGEFSCRTCGWTIPETGKRDANSERIKMHRDGTGHKAFKFALNLQEAG